MKLPYSHDLKVTRRVTSVKMRQDFLVENALIHLTTRNIDDVVHDLPHQVGDALSGAETNGLTLCTLESQSLRE